eukprot:1158154-Pelagomonas_calceolata.AAC.1
MSPSRMGRHWQELRMRFSVSSMRFLVSWAACESPDGHYHPPANAVLALNLGGLGGDSNIFLDTKNCARVVVRTVPPGIVL